MKKKKSSKSAKNQIQISMQKLNLDRKQFEEEKLIWEKEKEEIQGNLRNLEKRLNFQLNLIADLIHEQKSINEKLGQTIEQINYASQNIIDPQDPYDYESLQGFHKLLVNTSLSANALNDISNTRMEMLEFCMAPEVFMQARPKKVYIWKTMEKLYKSINNVPNADARIFNMTGKSHKYYSTLRILPIAFFIILENAYKYTPLDEIIEIDFMERNQDLIVSISNWGPEVEEYEISKIMERNYRGNNALKSHPSRGKGLGLPIMKTILDACQVSYNINVDHCDIKTIDSIKYSKFTITLNFNDMRA